MRRNAYIEIESVQSRGVGPDKLGAVARWTLTAAPNRVIVAAHGGTARASAPGAAVNGRWSPR